jgi:hypothetical protein
MLVCRKVFEVRVLLLCCLSPALGLSILLMGMAAIYLPPHPFTEPYAPDSHRPSPIVKLSEVTSHQERADAKVKVGVLRSWHVVVLQPVIGWPRADHQGIRLCRPISADPWSMQNTASNEGRGCEAQIAVGMRSLHCCCFLEGAFGRCGSLHVLRWVGL